MSKKKWNKGYTLIELMIVVAVIGVLAAIAIPIYRTNMVKAKLTEVVNSMAYVASFVGVYRQEAQASGGVIPWPDCPDIVSIQNSLGITVPDGKVSAAKITQATGEIEVTLQNISGDVDGDTLTLTPAVDANDGSIHWQWGGTIRTAYMPKK
jgi:type IV pilus assembly protein PilA